MVCLKATIFLSGTQALLFVPRFKSSPVRGLQMVNKDLGRVEQVSVALLRKLENQAMDLQLPDLTVQDSTFDYNLYHVGP